MAFHGTSLQPERRRFRPSQRQEPTNHGERAWPTTVGSQYHGRRVRVRAWSVGAVLTLLAAAIAGCGSGTTATSSSPSSSSTSSSPSSSASKSSSSASSAKSTTGNVQLDQLPGRQGTDLPGPRPTQDVDHHADRPRPPDRRYNRDQGLRRPGPNRFRCRQNGRETGLPLTGDRHARCAPTAADGGREPRQRRRRCKPAGGGQGRHRNRGGGRRPVHPTENRLRFLKSQRPRPEIR